MSEPNSADPGRYPLLDPVKLAQNMTVFFERAAEISRKIAENPHIISAQSDSGITPLDQISRTLTALTQSYQNEPKKFMALQSQLWADYTKLWQNSWTRALAPYLNQGQGPDAEAPIAPVIMPAPTDRRFKDKDWQENFFFDFLKQAYLISSAWAQDLVAQAEGLDDHTRAKARFYIEQFSNALSPSNFPFSNPEVLRTILARNGGNLLDGLKNLEKDFNSTDGRLHIRQSDTSAFELGRDIATTPGQVVFRNRLFELIQYAPTKANTYAIPLLIVPPWINKFYILDLGPQKSFVQWAVDQGFTVFIMSWVNEGEAVTDKSFADYMQEGLLTAVDTVKSITQQPQVNTIGYCIGGTLLACALGYLAAKGRDDIKTATFFTTQVDFEEAGDLKVFVDEEQLQWVEAEMKTKGYLHGNRMAEAFNLLRSNEMIWSYIINNYLLGKDPMPFDLLFWNSDNTCMPALVHSFYLREFYLHNRLAQGQLILGGEVIDLRQVKIPVYNLATREDHIAPLASVYKLNQFFTEATRFVVAASGHIAGVINPPHLQKYQYWTQDGASQLALDTWLATATPHKGSWWPDWALWLKPNAGPEIPAPKPVDMGEPTRLGAAPGQYVRVRTEDI